MKVTRQVSTTGTQRAPGHSAGPALPHEADQTPESQQEHEPREVGKRVYRNVDEGREDTDRWGGDESQKRTQNDEQANLNADEKLRHGGRRARNERVTVARLRLQRIASSQAERAGARRSSYADSAPAGDAQLWCGTIR